MSAGDFEVPLTIKGFVGLAGCLGFSDSVLRGVLCIENAQSLATREIQNPDGPSNASNSKIL